MKRALLLTSLIILLFAGISSGQTLFINEFLASNDSSYADENGDYDDWIEIYNAGTKAIDIGGMYITDDLAEPTLWQIPDTDPTKTTIQPGGFLVLWADKESEQGVLHLELKLSSDGEQIGLVQVVDNDTIFVDSLSFGEQAADTSYGRFPDGSSTWKFFTEPTPGASNGQINLFINEFLASNESSYADENGDYDDWIEIYNAGAEAVDIGGMFVTDDLTEPTLWQIPDTDPAKTTIQPGGFLVLWADKESEQGVLHIEVKLSSDGEQIGLVQVVDNDTIFVDSLSFGEQTADTSYGRFPDGSSTWKFFTEPTPGASNTEAAANLPPQISDITIAPDTITATTPVIVSAEVSDDNLASVTITYGEAGAINNSMAMTLSGSLYEAELGTFNNDTQIFLYITATDDEGESTVSDTLSFKVGYVAPVLFINEFLASNDYGLADPFGDNDDWIEIYNPNDYAVDIGGMYLTDDLTEPTLWQIPDTAPDSTTIPAGGFLVLWADKESEQGVLHLELKLSSDGEQIGLVQIVGTDTLFLDSLTFGEQSADTSYGRLEDGGAEWVFFSVPTPAESNSGGTVGIYTEKDLNVAEYRLYRNYPNPFNPTTTIAFNLPVAEKVTISVYNMAGQKVATLVNGKVNAGYNSVQWDARNFSSGIYFYTIKSASFFQTRKMVLLK